MKISIVRTNSEEAHSKLQFVESINTELQSFFGDKTYSEFLDSIVVSVICVHPKFDSFYHVRRSRYSKGTSVIKYEVSVTVTNSLELEFKLDFDRVMNGDDESNKEYLMHELSNHVLETVRKKKIPKFEKAIFKHDFESFINSPLSLSVSLRP